MNGFLKVLTAVLGILAVVACIATIGIVGYSVTNTDNSGGVHKEAAPLQASTVPTQLPVGQEQSGDEASDAAEVTPTPVPLVASGHVHDYEETVVKKATCYCAGQMRYACVCGDEYYVDVASTGHVPDDWEIPKMPTTTEEGLRVKKCIYCDEIVASEPVAMLKSSSAEASPTPAHVHQYTATTEREPSCVLAGLRRYSCSCGSFYTEMIPAPGHIASDWTVAEAATTTYMGREQRTCTVCGVLLDSRPVAMISASASPSASTSATASASTSASATAKASASAGTSASPSPSHTHNYVSYVLKEANCTERGIRSFVCTCGSSYAESIELDLNNHTYRAVVIPAAATTQGYTIYTCIRCNSSYYDNYTPPLDPVYANSQTGTEAAQ